MNYNISILEDHPIYRDGLKFMLEKNNSFWKIYTCQNKEELFQLLETTQMDILFVGINFNEDSRIKITKIVKSKYPHLKVIAISTYDKEEYIHQMLENGISAYLLKNEDKEGILKAIEVVSSGGNYFSSKILSAMYQGIANNKHTSVKEVEKVTITDRESEVLTLLCQGISRGNIGDRLHISQRTVDKHRENLQLKFNVENPIQLVLYAIRNEFVSLK